MLWRTQVDLVCATPALAQKPYTAPTKGIIRNSCFTYLSMWRLSTSLVRSKVILFLLPHFEIWHQHYFGAFLLFATVISSLNFLLAHSSLNLYLILILGLISQTAASSDTEYAMGEMALSYDVRVINIVVALNTGVLKTTDLESKIEIFFYDP